MLRSWRSQRRWIKNDNGEYSRSACGEPAGAAPGKPVLTMSFSPKQIVGAILLDWPRYEWQLRSSWLRIRNRNERLLASPDGRGIACQWQWTSDLYAPKLFASLGTRLMARCMRDWPFKFSKAPDPFDGSPQLSFIVGHRGAERAPLLLSTLATIAAQRGVACECIVVEQSDRSEIRELLPAWVRYIHTPLPVPELPYCRSWALNVGARAAKGKALVFHDNDMLIPQAYAAELWARFQEGYEAVNLKRFVFYLTDTHSRAICSAAVLTPPQPAEAIVQNLEAGGSVAMSRDAFFAIGGFDESFIGWGGEDNELWERAQTRSVWPYAYLPIIHLWHPSQPRKGDPENPTARRQAELSALSPSERIARLTAREFGHAQRLSGVSAGSWIALSPGAN